MLMFLFIGGTQAEANEIKDTFRLRSDMLGLSKTIITTSRRVGLNLLKTNWEMFNAVFLDEDTAEETDIPLIDLLQWVKKEGPPLKVVLLSKSSVIPMPNDCQPDAVVLKNPHASPTEVGDTIKELLRP
jgi:hypothetical protein